MYTPTHYVVHDHGTVLAWWPMADTGAEAAAQRMARDTGHQVEYAQYRPADQRPAGDGPWRLNGR